MTTVHQKAQEFYAELMEKKTHVASPSVKKRRATSKMAAAAAAKKTKSETATPTFAHPIKEPTTVLIEESTVNSDSICADPRIWTILALFSVAAGLIGCLLACAILGAVGDGGAGGASSISSMLKDTATPQPTMPCFFDYPVHEEVFVPLHCSGGQPRLQCPVGGLCANGKLFACAKEYTEPSQDHSQCLMKDAAKSSIEFLKKKIKTSSVAILCHSATANKPGSFFAKLDDETGNPLFWYDRLADYFGIDHKSDFIRAANKGPGGPFFLLEDESLIGISATLDVPITCKLKSHLSQLPARSISFVPFPIMSATMLALAVWLKARKQVGETNDTSEQQEGFGVRFALNGKLIMKKAAEAAGTALGFPSKESHGQNTSLVAPRTAD